MRPVQIYGRLAHRFWRPIPDISPAPPRSTAEGDWQKPVAREPSLIGPSTFKFMSQVYTLKQASDWNDPRQLKLWLYNLHYFDDLSAQGNQGRGDWHQALLHRWVAENPTGRGNGWEPYPLSLRIVNWLKWAFSGCLLDQTLTNSLATQVRYLRKRIEYHLLGNHLLVNGKSLAFAGLFFSGPEAEAWLATGEKILRKEIKEQILADGGHFERSPMYHLLIFEDLLDLYNAYIRYRRPFPDDWKDAIELMLSWSAVMRHPDGEIPFFNDAALGVAPSPAQLDDYAAELGFTSENPGKSLLLEDSGFVRLQRNDARLIADVGSVGPDYLPAHAHAGTLSFEFSLHGRRLLVNSGTSLYEPGPERERQRATAAHNTVEVDGQSSSEVWASFRVARRAKVDGITHDFKGDTVIVEARHDGYSRLNPPVVHHRQWQLGKDSLRITDRMESRRHHLLRLIFLVHPDVQVIEQKAGFLLQSKEANHGPVRFHPDHLVEFRLEPGSYHPRFGVDIPTTRILCKLEARLPQTFETLLTWD